MPPPAGTRAVAGCARPPWATLPVSVLFMTVTVASGGDSDSTPEPEGVMGTGDFAAASTDRPVADQRAAVHGQGTPSAGLIGQRRPRLTGERRRSAGIAAAHGKIVNQHAVRRVHDRAGDILQDRATEGVALYPNHQTRR